MGETEAETRWAEVGKWEMEWEVPAGGKAGEGTTGEAGWRSSYAEGEEDGLGKSRFVFQ